VAEINEEEAEKEDEEKDESSHEITFSLFLWNLNILSDLNKALSSSPPAVEQTLTKTKILTVKRQAR
jgi:hypothetical protein